jgi:hypothetical protein
MIQKKFVKNNKIIHVHCQKCGNTRNKDVSKYLALSLEQEIKFKYNCPCGHSFPLIIERRGYIRRPVNFTGSITCKKKKYGVTVLDILVMDISRYGLKIKLVDKLDIKENQQIEITFHLDDATKSKVRKEAIVKNINFPIIGLEFLTHDHYDKFGSYILFNFNKH